MNADEMMAYAKAIASGGKIANGDVRKFMRALLAEPGMQTTEEEEPEPAPDAEPAPTSLYVSVNQLGAVHVSVSRFFSKAEAMQFGRAVIAAAQG